MMKDFILKILGDHRGWGNKFHFAEVTKDDNLFIDIEEPSQMPTGFEGFSVYEPFFNRIRFNKLNWDVIPQGYLVKRDNATLEDYRTHLVNHEVAHHFGHGHGRCDITEQPTVSTVCEIAPTPFQLPNNKVEE